MAKQHMVTVLSGEKGVTIKAGAVEFTVPMHAVAGILATIAKCAGQNAIIEARNLDDADGVMAATHFAGCMFAIEAAAKATQDGFGAEALHTVTTEVPRDGAPAPGGAPS